MKDNVVELFVDKTNINQEQIKVVDKLKGGSSSNRNYLVELIDGTKFQVKFPDERMVSKKSVYAYKQYNASMIKFIGEDGTLIKEWIEGRHPDLNNKDDAKKVLQEIKKFHDIKLPKESIDEFGIYEYRETTNISKELLKEFDQLCKILDQFPRGFIHGDINPGNILVNDEQAFLIDLEWAMSGWLILDYAYLIAFSNIDIHEVSEFSGYTVFELKKMVRLVRIHTLMWCENEKTEKADMLFEDILNKLN
ncbi:phosphotransferase enzyme family protein [Mycoplasma todarodis]|uniref:Aminoglycoside phosphotransferase domain-containing protein n=1 Tax=Mycoplasma todarodis TaxID=1937191 RepID=A0A4R0XNI3_9MOLU|nr:phosphotransferase [Mycoplasma todarodis]TCG10515.1 hypothetical protein C4B25_03890 [Mycoplasma todarodis]